VVYHGERSWTGGAELGGIGGGAERPNIACSDEQRRP
jgi:hypothetical protein